MLRTVPFVYPRTSQDVSCRPHTTSAISKVRKRGSQKEQERGEWARLQNTIFLSPERWHSLIAVLGAHELTAFVKVFQVYRVQVWLRGRSPTPGRRGDIGPHADARAAAWRRARTSGAHGCCPGFGTLRAVACRTRDARRRHVFRRDARSEGEYPRTHAATRCSLESLVDISPQLEHDGKH